MSNKLKLVEDEIGRHLEESLKSGELSRTEGYGKPLQLHDGYTETPDALRMGYKILKDAGYFPPEVDMMKRAAALRDDMARATTAAEHARLQQQLHELEVSLSLARERLTGNGVR